MDEKLILELLQLRGRVWALGAYMSVREKDRKEAYYMNSEEIRAMLGLEPMQTESEAGTDDVIPPWADAEVIKRYSDLLLKVQNA